MSISLQYSANGIYTAHLERGEIEISAEEIHDLIRSLDAIGDSNEFLEDFGFNECWVKSLPKIKPMLNGLIKQEDEEFKETVNATMEEVLDEIITDAQEVANEYYSRNYILIGKDKQCS